MTEDGPAIDRQGGGDFAPKNGAGAVYLLQSVLLTGSGLVLAASAGSIGWLAGQLLLAVAWLQWFVLLHEAGHHTLFANRALNTLCGHLAGFMSGFPFLSWRLIHYRHHKWTGWQDLDATTASLVPRPIGRFESTVIDFCWRFWIPLFVLVYRFNNYWNYPRLKRYLPGKGYRKKVLLNILALLGAYAGVIHVFGASTLLGLTWLSVLVSLIVQEIILLSQHTHIPSMNSRGEVVQPVAAIDQEKYTRSLAVPEWAAKCLLMNFNLHELHHMFVKIPGYALHKISRRTMNEVDWLRWTVESRRVPGTVFLFNNRDQTGAPL